MDDRIPVTNTFNSGGARLFDGYMDVRETEYINQKVEMSVRVHSILRLSSVSVSKDLGFGPIYTLTIQIELGT